jgi:hypothetical protein
MALFIAKMTHSAESCYLFNEETLKKLKELVNKREEVAKKHGINVITAVYPPLEHEILYIMEAPSHKAVERYLSEIGFAFYNKIEIRYVEPVENIFKAL